jgi:rhodanese-related sulfurtransferase
LSFNPAQNIKLIDSETVEELLQDDGVFILQAHTPYQGELNGTDLILEDWQNIASYQDQLPKDKSTPILVYCRSGRMSAISAKQLEDLGYETIYDFEGGMKAWEASGRKLIFN